ncbi:hypothetical protein RY27_25040, partial [Litorilinea aerophila]
MGQAVDLGRAQGFVQGVVPAGQEQQQAQPLGGRQVGGEQQHGVGRPCLPGVEGLVDQGIHRVAGQLHERQGRGDPG